MASTLSPSLSISIVVYALSSDELTRNLRTLKRALDAASVQAALSLIDNSEQGEHAAALGLMAEAEGFKDASVISGHGNVGYGAGHNLAIKKSTADAHLVLNPDVDLDVDALRCGLDSLFANAAAVVGAVGRDAQNKPAYLSKRMPSLWVLFLRGFAPAWLKRRFDARLAIYEYRDLPLDRPSEVSLVSGAFMLCNRRALQSVGGFDERYFLHFEDFDLSCRLAKLGKVISDPSVTLVHLGGHSAKRGLKMILMFFRSAFRFFNSHGWRWL